MPSFLKNVSILTFGTVLAQILNVVVAPILVRYFPPEAFGIAGLFATFAGLIGIFACLQFELAIILPDSDNEATNLFVVSVLCSIPVSLLTLILIYLLKDYILYIFNAEALYDYIYFLPPMIFLVGIFRAATFWYTRFKRFKLLSFIRIINSIFSNLFKLIMGILGYISGGVLIFAALIGLFISNIISILNIWNNKKHIFLHNINSKEIISGVKKYRKFPQYVIWSGLLTELSFRLPIIFIACFFSPSELGFFVIVHVILKTPLNTFGNSLAMVFYQKAPSLKQDLQSLSSAVEKIWYVLASLSIFPSILLLMFGRELFSLILGQNWIEAGIYAQILAISLIIDFLFISIYRLYDVFNKQKEALYFDILLCVITSICLFLGYALNNIYYTLILFVLGDATIKMLRTYFIINMIGIQFKAIYLPAARITLNTFPFIGILLILNFVFKLNALSLLITSILLIICNIVLNIYKNNHLNFSFMFGTQKDKELY